MTFLDEATRRDDLFVQPVGVTADHDQPGVGDHGRRVEDVVGDDTGRDPLELRPALFRPDFGPQQPQAHLDQPVVQMNQDHVVPAIGHDFVERDRANVLGVRMLQTFGTRGPTSPERRQAETRLAVVGLGRDQRRLARQRQGHLDDLLDVVGRQPQFPPCLPVLLHQGLHLLLQVTLEPEHLADRLGISLCVFGVQGGAPSQHGLFDLLGDHRPDLAEVFPDRFDLERHPHQELKVGLHVRHCR